VDEFDAAIGAADSSIDVGHETWPPPHDTRIVQPTRLPLSRASSDAMAGQGAGRRAILVLT